MNFKNWLRENNLYSGEFLIENIKEIFFDGLDLYYEDFEIQNFYNEAISSLRIESIYNYDSFQLMINNAIEYKNFLISEHVSYDILKDEFSIDFNCSYDYRILACENPIRVFDDYGCVLEDLEMRFGDYVSEDLEKEIALYEEENNCIISESKKQEIKNNLVEIYYDDFEYHIYKDLYYTSYDVPNDFNYFKMENMEENLLEIKKLYHKDLLDNTFKIVDKVKKVRV